MPLPDPAPDSEPEPPPDRLPDPGGQLPLPEPDPADPDPLAEPLADADWVAAPLADASAGPRGAAGAAAVAEAAHVRPVVVAAGGSDGGECQRQCRGDHDAMTAHKFPPASPGAAAW